VIAFRNHMIASLITYKSATSCDDIYTTVYCKNKIKKKLENEVGTDKIQRIIVYCCLYSQAFLGLAMHSQDCQSHIKKF